MIYIYQADSKYLQDKKGLNYLLRELPENMHERALRYRFKQDAYNYVLGRLLLKKALSAVGLGERFKHIAYRKNDKPFLEGVHFNISHSDNLVVCALSTEGEIGIDVEKEKQIKPGDFKSWFTNTEWTDINNASQPIKKFYWYWTRKESIIKALGVTLSYLHKIELDAKKDYIIEKGKKWYLKDLDFGQVFLGRFAQKWKLMMLF